ncbi:TPA: hypothetical protein GE554_07130 [Escherichia coli]|nr:hypothetical protein BMR41_04220 [Escherichia coli]RCP89586.1 hypothetical protein APT25_22330 [Escherichia coli]THJ89333.1 hypothetical protein DF178_16590 [Escherichia coli]HAH0231304.1 hypothetical protein [Escherichia coli]HAH2766745.1 hypothetical protein [Escherichia coli]
MSDISSSIRTIPFHRQPLSCKVFNSIRPLFIMPNATERAGYMIGFIQSLRRGIRFEQDTTHSKGHRSRAAKRQAL